MTSLKTNSVQAGYRNTPQKSEEKEYTLHCHTYYEIYYLKNGQVNYLIEGKSYKPQPDSMLLIAPNVFHGFMNMGSDIYERYCIHFLPEAVAQNCREELLKSFYADNVYYTNISSSATSAFIEQIFSGAKMTKTVMNEVVNARIVSLLGQIHDINPLGNETHQSSKQHFNAADIIAYINANLTGEISLESICRHFYISKNHLNRIFSAATGTTVANYINIKRTTLVQQYVLDGQNISEAAYNCGFKDYSTFYRSYKKIYGAAPYIHKLTSRNSAGVHH